MLFMLYFPELIDFDNAPFTDEGWVDVLEQCSALGNIGKCKDLLTRFYNEHGRTCKKDLFMIRLTLTVLVCKK